MRRNSKGMLQLFPNMLRGGVLLSGLIICCCESSDPQPNPIIPPPVPNDAWFEIANASNLPVGNLGGRSMDAKFADFDNDGDQDLILASEFDPNILLINDGNAVFTDESDARLPRSVRDSEDVGVADFDGDGDLDIVVVSEDDLINELYFNDGSGNFEDVSERLPVDGISNAVLTEDIDLDGDVDILIGNRGLSVILINDGQGNFVDESTTRMIVPSSTTQDIELGDVDGDGDLDLVMGNEDRNRLLINEGGVFSDDSEARIPIVAGVVEETREADFGDVDGDGDLDLLFSNVNLIDPNNPQNRLLLNDGTGHFTDVTTQNLPVNNEGTVDGDFLDIDQDGDLDIVTGNLFLLPSGIFEASPYRIWTNDGTGVFIEETLEFFPQQINGFGFDIEASDLNGDGKLDLYLASRGGNDVLLLSR